MRYIYAHMKLLIPISEIEKLKYKDTIPLECEQCGKHFSSTKQRYYIGIVLRNRKNALSYCSPECRNDASIRKVDCICAQCGKSFIRTPSGINERNFCTQSCAAVYNNARKVKKVKPPKPVKVKPPVPILECELCKQSFPRKTTNVPNKSGKVFCSKSCRMRWYNINKPADIGGKVRSRFEIYMEEKIKEEFANLNPLFNNRSTIGYELDVYIPCLNLAFEFNGPHHYIPIRGAERFEKIKYKDAQKQQLCEKLNIKLITYDICKVNGKDKTALGAWWENIKKDISCCNLSVTQLEPRGGATTFPA